MDNEKKQFDYKAYLIKAAVGLVFLVLIKVFAFDPFLAKGLIQNTVQQESIRQADTEAPERINTSESIPEKQEKTIVVENPDYKTGERFRDMVFTFIFALIALIITAIVCVLAIAWFDKITPYDLLEYVFVKGNEAVTKLITYPICAIIIAVALLLG